MRRPLRVMPPLANEELRRRMGRTARWEATRGFGTERLLSGIAELYLRLTASRDWRPEPVPGGQVAAEGLSR